MEKSIGTGWICPNCGAALRREPCALRCGNGHSFDIAKEGYVNLSLSARKGESRGDNAEMVRARVAFLSQGYYLPLAQALRDAVAPYANGTLAEAGCGWGYYLDAVAQAYPWDAVYGTDLSKFAIKVAAKRNPKIAYAVANSFSLPLATGGVDVLLNVFSPIATEEFARVVRPNGVLVTVTPDTWHLRQLKYALYADRTRPNPPPRELPAPWRAESDRVCAFGKRVGARDLEQLVHMTPYLYKTGKEDLARLDGIGDLETDFAFRIRVYRRDGKTVD